MRPKCRVLGFAMIELLAVLVIAVVLYTMALGPVRSYLDGKRRSECAENLRKLHLVLTLYANEHHGTFPAGAASSDEAFAQLVPKCTTDTSIFHCPVSEKKECYSYLSGLGKNDTGPLVIDGQAFHGNSPGNVLYIDGHIDAFPSVGPRLPAPPPKATLLEPKS
jgi:prepilin-type processing-associated H-X9-DG protein